MDVKIGMDKVGLIKGDMFHCVRDARKFQIYYKKKRFVTIGGYMFDCPNAIGFVTYKVKQMFANGVKTIVCTVKGHQGENFRIIRIPAKDLPMFGEKIKEEHYEEQYIISLDRYW